jgi:pyruvate dehydrogenase E2 component (dihydrolipoamide acetyltransferase)
MAADVTIPRLGWSMEEGVFAGWLKQPGDQVRPGEPLFMLEGEKATQEIEAVDGGTLHVAPDAPAAGQTVLVGRVIAKLCSAGESPVWSAASPASPASAAGPASRPSAAERKAAAVGSTPAVRPAGHVAPLSGEIPAAASPTVRRLARQLGVDLARVAPHLPGGRLTAEDVVVARGGPSPGVGPIVSSPRARRAARQHGVALETVLGGGAGGRIRERDVLAALHVAPAATKDVPTAAKGDPTGPTMPVSHTRRLIARHMVRSREQTVPVTVTAWADATGLLAAREGCKAADGAEAATFNDMLLKCLAAAIRRHPQIAARWEETHLVLPGDSIDIGLAVDAPVGLVVPVIRDVEAVSLAGVAAQTRGLVAKARAGRLVSAEMQGAVFTLTSLGSYGVEFFTPVINLPETAILGVGAIRLQPVPSTEVRDGFTMRRHLPLSLTFDHRVVDGGPAARFLDDLARSIAAIDPATVRA